MAKDHRLDLGRYIDYSKDIFAKKQQLNFDDLFAAKASSGASPWMPSRFESTDLLRRIQTRKLKLNPNLNFVGDQPEEYEVFAGLGRFKRKDDYDFETGRPLTTLRPEEQPGFSDVWVEAYQLSPTLNPDKRTTNPMPRVSNPDPRGYLMETAERRVEAEMDDDKSVSQLLSENSKTTFNKNNKEPKA